MENKNVEVKESLESLAKHFLEKDLKDCTLDEIFALTTVMTKDRIENNKNNVDDDKNRKDIYYFSAEFLIGKLLSNNLINLGIYNDVNEVLKGLGYSMAELEEIENEPSLGNGGLGRLAACFLDSFATLKIYGHGIGLKYHYGLFKQKFSQDPNSDMYLKQGTAPDEWIDQNSWAIKQSDEYNVELMGKVLKGLRYAIDVTGYKNNNSIDLSLFDSNKVDDSIINDGINYDMSDIEKCITLSLYPNDNIEAGKKLRICQEYFMVSCGAQMIINNLKERNIDLRDMAKHVAIQINDTHPSMVIPELIRLLTAEGISFDEAIEIVTNTCAYTNHTILAEALEKWKASYLDYIVPGIMNVIRELDRRIKEKYNDVDLHIITTAKDKDGNEYEEVNMARMDIHYSHSINGVAYLHTEILKNSELKQFYALYPDKFNNKTNGITFRRWLIECNPRLTAFIDELIGDSWKKDAIKLKDLEKYINDENVLKALMDIKRENKVEFSNYMYGKQKSKIDPDSIYDVHSKRLHMYKRQSLNYEHILYLYKMISKYGYRPKTPITVVFGAKGADSYYEAKAQIHNLLVLEKQLQREPEIQKYLNLVYIENYNVTQAEKLIPAADISEQISLASQEASGTGNMKFMLNGALTLGTLDGANVEIKNLVGEENISIFGMDSEDVLKYLTLYDPEQDWHRLNYNPRDIYNADNGFVSDEYKNAGLLKFIFEGQDDLAKKAKDLIDTGESTNYFWGLTGILKNCDYYMNNLDLIGSGPKTKKILIPDENGGYKEHLVDFKGFDGYFDVKNKMLDDYEDKFAWARKALINIANAGFFSSDRTIEEYNNKIWHATKAGENDEHKKIYIKK